MATVVQIAKDALQHDNELLDGPAGGARGAVGERPTGSATPQSTGTSNEQLTALKRIAEECHLWQADEFSLRICDIAESAIEKAEG